MDQDPSIEFPNTVADFTICFDRCIDADGSVVNDALPGWAVDPEIVIPLYRNMVLTRVFDKKALNLQRSGRLGTFGSPLGQEAIGAGVASAMNEEDVLVPSYREFSAQLWRGVTMTELLLYWGGDERGSDFQGPREDFPNSVPVASHTCHAAGVAYAFRLRKQPRVAVCCIGDGATSKGDFYESINAAGVWQLPLVVVVSNNQWAISVPLSRQTAAKTLAQKAIAAGIGCEQVDGNDVIAVRKASLEAIERARSGGGPYLVEAITYRLGDHTTADDASRYRDPAEVDSQRANDPIRRLRSFLEARNLWSGDDEEKLTQECAEKVDSAVEEYLELPPQEPGAMFDHLFKDLPASLTEQRGKVEQNGE